MPKFERITPILSVKDVPASIDFYVNKLGFKKDWDWGTPPGFGSVSRGDVNIFLCKDGQGNPGTWLFIFVEDVDALYAEIQANGVNIRQKPTNLPWGMREMNVEDPDGHRLRLGSECEESSDDVQPFED